MQPEQIGLGNSATARLFSPNERDPCYFRAWQRVSIALQKVFVSGILNCIFATILPISRSRNGLHHGRIRGVPGLLWAASLEFTYDVADPETFYSAWRSLGNSVRTVLAPIEKRLRDSDEVEVARRYGSVWHQDVLMSVKQHPRPFIRLIALEARLVEAVIDMGTRRNERAVIRFHRIAENTLSSFYGDDMTELIPGLIEEATRVLTADFVSRSNHLLDAGIAKHDHARAAGSPDLGIGGQENGNHRRPHGGGKMADAGIVADVYARGREPAAEVV